MEQMEEMEEMEEVQEPEQMEAEEVELQPEEEQKPWYGERRYSIVDHVEAQIAEKESKNKISAVDMVALRAQQPYLTLSMKELGDSYDGPPKYMSQKDAPLEIPYEVIKKLFTAMDEDLDDQLTLDEMKRYVRKHEIDFTEKLVEEIFYEATSFRRLIHERQIHDPLKIEEMQMAVRGRYSYNKETKQWGVTYRPYRN